MARVSSPGMKKSGAMTDETRKAEAKKGLVHKVEKSRQAARDRSFQLRHYNHCRGLNSVEWNQYFLSLNKRE